MKSKTTLTALSLILVAGAAWAAHPEADRGNAAIRHQVEEVQKLAHEVEDRARLVHRSAERSAHHRSHREARALVRLHELEEQARHFHAEVESYGQSFHHTEADFRELRRAYSRAAYAMHNLHAFRNVNRQFDRLSDAMYELEMYAEDLFDRVRPASRRYRDRHDRDWNGDHRRRDRGHARIVLPRVRVSWDWLNR